MIYRTTACGGRVGFDGFRADWQQQHVPLCTKGTRLFELSRKVIKINSNWKFISPHDITKVASLEEELPDYFGLLRSHEVITPR